MADNPDLDGFVAVVLAGGRGSRLGGADKASVEIAGRTMLALALDAVVDAAEVVVVGKQVRTERPVTFVVESPRYGGPAAGLLTGLDAVLRRTRTVVVLAVDMPLLTHRTVRRLQAGAAGHDGAALRGPDGRRQLALVLDRDRLAQVRPSYEDQHNLPLHRLLAPLDLADVDASDDEHRDVDSWEDLRDLASEAAEEAVE